MSVVDKAPCLLRLRDPIARGFSLVEMIIVIAVLAILAALVIPEYQHIEGSAEATAAGASMEAIAKAVQHYQAIHGEWPEDKNRRVLPPELSEYLPTNEFESAPLGGVWDYEDWRGRGYSVGGGDIGIAISIVEGDPDLYEAVDREIDDGNLSTGVVQYYSGSPRLVYIVMLE